MVKDTWDAFKDFVKNPITHWIILLCRKISKKDLSRQSEGTIRSLAGNYLYFRNICHCGDRNSNNIPMGKTLLQ